MANLSSGSMRPSRLGSAPSLTLKPDGDKRFRDGSSKANAWKIKREHGAAHERRPKPGLSPQL